MHPLVVYSPFPVEFLRHISFGIPFATIGVAYAALVTLRAIDKFLSKYVAPRWLLFALLLFSISGLVYYETERLAKPEWYFGGKATLLWTGSSYLLTDILKHPVPLPQSTDTRSGEEIREAVVNPIAANDLRRVNLSEPYHWSALLIALFGLVWIAIAALGTHPRRSPPRDRTAHPTAFEPPICP